MPAEVRAGDLESLLEVLVVAREAVLGLIHCGETVVEGHSLHIIHLHAQAAQRGQVIASIRGNSFRPFTSWPLKIRSNHTPESIEYCCNAQTTDVLDIRLAE